MEQYAATKHDLERIHERLDKIVEQNHERWEEIIKIVERCSVCNPKLNSVDRVIWEDSGITVEDGVAGGLLAVVRLHHTKIREFEEVCRLVKVSLLKMFIGVVASSGIGGAIVAAVMNIWF